MPLEQTFYDPALFWYLIGLVVLTLTVDTIQRLLLRNARGDRCKTSFVNRLVAELMLFGMAAVTIMTMYEATARYLSPVVVDQVREAHGRALLLALPNMSSVVLGACSYVHRC